MANTEGLPDEFVESLMTTSMSTPTSSSTSSNSNKTSKSAQQRRLQERLNMPMGAQPAAKIIRPSRSPRTSPQTETVQAETVQEDDDDEYEEVPAQTSQQQQNQQQPKQSHFAILGNVVERPQATQKQSARKKGKLSRFAQQQQRNAANGFPSVHVPLGTFLQPKNKKKVNTNRNSGVPPPKVRAAPNKVVVGKDTTIPESTSSETVQDASHRDAQNMLAQMTPDEIREHQQELQAAMSPDMLAFMKKRAAAKQQTMSQQKEKQQQQQKQLDVPKTRAAPTELKAATSNKALRKDGIKEKERIAKLVSSVKTHIDLDAAYHEVMQEAHPLENKKPESNADDFALACDLLRSTAPRQALWAARAVSQRLDQYYVQQQGQGQSVPQERDWPLILPVSLRCLLDQPMATGHVLHTYVLQSLHSLLLLTARPDHVVRVASNAPPTDGDIYQEIFLDDAIPTPRLDTAYESVPVQPLQTGKDQPAAAYATSSSSTSAIADGEAFDKDPMWTLLSKMRMLPRLAKVLQFDNLPREAWVASGGILCMLSQRSPGAASAIVHHGTILPQITSRALIQPLQQDQQAEDWALSFATMKLFCTLARQSRVTAQSLPIQDILPPLLARTASSRLEFQVQKLGLQLWRTLLRYGLGLEALSTMTTCASRHLALPYSQEFSLSAEFVAALAQVLELAKLARSKTREQTKIPPDAMDILSIASTYVAATQGQILPEAPSTSTSASTANNQDDECHRYRWNAGRLRFLSTFWSLSESTTNEEIKTEDWSMEQVLTCLEALDGWTDSAGDVESACKVVLQIAASEECPSSSQGTNIEAAACGFLASFSLILLTIETSSNTQGNRMVQELCRSVMTRFQDRLLDGLKAVASAAPTSKSASKQISLARLGWVNHCHFAISKFLFHCMTAGVLTDSSDIQLVRMLVFSLLGKLDRGGESTAAVLFSHDSLLKPSSDPLQAESESSPISSMFLGELCGSDRARKQLDHSFKLQHGFGITSAGFGAFALDSLLSDADQPDSSSELVLPIGNLWLWHTLSGYIRMKEVAVDEGTAEARNVVAAVLSLILELEEGEEVVGAALNGYAARIPLGAKLYYLMNVCLHPETVLRDDRVLETAEAVLQRYWLRLDKKSVLDFCKACQQHTEPAKKESLTGNEDAKLEEKEKKFFEILDHHPTNNLELTTPEMRALEAFWEDLSEAYIDYGAQYDFFTKCIRLFLLPIFPTSIQCRALRELREILHLLTLSREMEDENAMSSLLVHSVAGGLPEKDDSTRDPPEIVDVMASLLAPGGTPRPLKGYVQKYSIALLARSLAISLTGSGLEFSKQRLVQLDAHAINSICEVASTFLANGGTKKSLVEATISLDSSTGPIETPIGTIDEDDLEGRLNEMKAQL